MPMQNENNLWCNATNSGLTRKNIPKSSNTLNTKFLFIKKVLLSRYVDYLEIFSMK